MEYRLARKPWKECKILVDSITRNNIYLTPYSYYDFLNQIKLSPNIHQIREAFKTKFFCYVFYKNKTECAVVPIQVNKANKRIYFLGFFTSVGYMDLIYRDDFNLDDFENLIKLMCREYNGYSIFFDRISQYSLTYSFLKTMGHDLKQSTCVGIDITDGYDNWFNNLGKSCRQNIRTSYNRLTKDQCRMKYFSCIGEKPDNKLFNDSIALFSKRLLEHGKHNNWMFYPTYILKKNEPFTKALFNSKSCIFACIYINDTLAATCNGVISNDGRAIITRLSIEIEMGRYSPGGLLINEMIKEYTEKYPYIKCIDLSRGTEPYKYTYGGKEHYNYACSFVLK